MRRTWTIDLGHLLAHSRQGGEQCHRDVADDHYHRYKEDVQLMKALGVKAYRFSIAWPRVFPQGAGSPNPKGLDFYNRLVDELLANDIKPFATLYHWDLPQALQDKGGGWESRDTSKAFGEYAGYVAEHLSDRVKHFFTINEFGAFVELGYRIGIHAPGLKLPPGRFNQPGITRCWAMAWLCRRCGRRQNRVRGSD